MASLKDWVRRVWSKFWGRPYNRAVSAPTPQDHHPGGIAQDCGPVLTPLFQRLFDGSGDVDLDEFKAAAHDYFLTSPNPDHYFNNFAILALPYPEARLFNLRLLDIGLQVAHEWEASNSSRVHKGSGYYFAAIRDIVLGDLDRGFLFMHQALAEDVISGGAGASPDTPARAFVTMDAAKQDQFFRAEVTRYAALVERRLETYRATGRGALTFADLRARVLARPPLLEPLFSLVFAVARIIQLEEPTVSFARENDFASLLFGQIAFDLCQVIDECLGERFPGVTGFLMLATNYASTPSLGLSQADLQDANTAFGTDFPLTMTAVLDGSYRDRTGAAPSALAYDLLVAYGVRNRMAHGLGSDEFIRKRFEGIEERLFFVVFSIVERLF